MQQALYGADIILLPEHMRGNELHEQGKVIELNGVGSGMSFYAAQDFAFYDRFALAIKDRLKPGQLAMIQYNPLDEFDIQLPDCSYAFARAQHDSDAAELVSHLNAQKQKDYLTVTDTQFDELERKLRLSQKFYRSNTPFILQALRDNDVPFMTYYQILQKQSDGEIKFQTVNIDPEYMRQFQSHPRQLSGPLASVTTVPPYTYGEGTVSSCVVGLHLTLLLSTLMMDQSKTFYHSGIEHLCSDKLLQYMLPQFATEGDFADYLPHSFAFGAGLHTRAQFREWMAQQEGDIFVRKPINMGQGAGVRMYTREEMRQFDEPAFAHQDLEHLLKIFQEIGFELKSRTDFLNGDFLNHNAVLFQELVPSALIEDPSDAGKYPACARAIVVDGKCIGAYWRSNKVGPEGSLVDRLSHNKTNKAHAIKMNPRDYELVSQIAEQSVGSFETTAISAITNLCGDNDDAMKEEFEDADDSDTIRLASYYLRKPLVHALLARSAQQLGLEDLPSIDELSYGHVNGLTDIDEIKAALSENNSKWDSLKFRAENFAYTISGFEKHIGDDPELAEMFEQLKSIGERLVAKVKT